MHAYGNCARLTDNNDSKVFLNGESGAGRNFKPLNGKIEVIMENLATAPLEFEIEIKDPI